MAAGTLLQEFIPTLSKGSDGYKRMTQLFLLTLERCEHVEAEIASIAAERSKAEEERHRREEEQRMMEEKERMERLSSFENLDPEVVERILNLADGDISEATDKILDAIGENAQQDIERDAIVQETHDAFPEIPIEDIRLALELNNWNPMAAVNDFVRILREKQSTSDSQTSQEEEVKTTLVTQISEELLLETNTVRAALTSTNWDEQKAKLLLLNLEDENSRKILSSSGSLEPKGKEEELRETVENWAKDHKVRKIQHKTRVEDQKEWKRKSRHFLFKKLEAAVPFSKKSEKPKFLLKSPSSQDSAFFGKPLGTYEEFGKSGKTHFVDGMIDLFREKYMEEEGIFRMSGQSSNVTELRKKLDRQKWNFDAKYSANDFASLFKLYFRELPDPLVPFDCFDHFLGITRFSSEEQRVAALKSEFNELPPVNQTVLTKLLRFLADIASQSSQNKMTASNLSTCFAPNLLRPQTETMESILKNAPLVIVVMTLMINNHVIITNTSTSPILKRTTRLYTNLKVAFNQ
eukprot:TRINITY_DN6365_c0_g1_i1.p1 TRINITY_DN6365_c0_g1~~TRINITY_DN6365_c0_g1_i1.p1  ORF type:complete len:566 (+),score=193.35 TRINITY_DN6365_c0_g1_i1:135-1700(+)